MKSSRDVEEMIRKEKEHKEDGDKKKKGIKGQSLMNVIKWQFRMETG